jgi:hypothetical protein
MAIFFGKNKITRLEAGIRKDRKGCYRPSAFQTRYFLGRVLWKKKKRSIP